MLCIAVACASLKLHVTVTGDTTAEALLVQWCCLDRLSQGLATLAGFAWSPGTGPAGPLTCMW